VAEREIDDFRRTRGTADDNGFSVGSIRKNATTIQNI